MPKHLDWLRYPSSLHLTNFQRFLVEWDWSQSALGSIETWKPELRQLVRLMIADTAPAIIYWGPTRAAIYNEAYIPLVGQKHPNMLGKNAADIFPEFWDYFEKIIVDQGQTGQTTSGQASRLLMVRQEGFLEETYFDWKLIPIIGDDGDFLGTYGPPHESTERVISERRTACVQELTRRIASTTSYDTLWTETVSSLLTSPQDIPFAMILASDQALGIESSVDDLLANVSFHTVATVGVPENHVLKDFCVNPTKTDARLHAVVRDAIATLQPKLITTEDSHLRALLSDLVWAEAPCHQFMILPVQTSGRVPVILIMGINPYRRYNSWYQDFLTSLTEILASQLSKIRLSEELRYRSQIAKEAHHAFKQSETRFTRFASRSPVGLAVSSLSGKIVFANDSWCSISGIDPKQLDGTFDWHDTIMEDDLPLLAKVWHTVTVLKETEVFTYRLKQPFQSGDMYLPNRTAYAACYADLDEDGNVETVMGLVVDISEQKWIEKQLIERTKELETSEQRYRSFADICPLGVVSTDANGYVQLGNDAWHDFYGFKKGEVPDPEPWIPHIHLDNVEKAKQYFIDLQTTKGPHTVELMLKRKYTIYESEKTLENDAWVLATGMQEYNEDGTINHIDFWVVDISAQKMAEKILTEKMDEAIRTRTQQERFVDMISHEIRNPLSAILHSGEDIIESLKQCLIHLGNTTYGSIHYRPMMEDNTKELLLSSLESANTVLYCVQHQKQIVDDVLTLSKLDSELLVVHPVPVQLSDLVTSTSKIFDPELRMSSIVFNVQEHDSITSHAIDWMLLDRTRFLQILINLITNAIKFTKGCPVRKITIKISAHEDRPCDFEELDFIPRRYNPIQQHSSSAQLESNQSGKQFFLRVSISDTGRGLSAQEKQNLFIRFSQASPKTEVEYGGSGLGLFISRQISEMMGGEIGVGVSESGGCTFAFYVAASKIQPPQAFKSNPMQSTAATVRAVSAPVSLLPTQKSSKVRSLSVHSAKNESRKVLVVEDNVVNQKVLCKQLRNRGFEVEAANHGKEALLALETAQNSSDKHFDVVLCDIEMPIMDGIECVKEVRSREADGRLEIPLPVIGVTANVRSKQVELAVEAGMNGVTTKPYRIDDLIAHIDRVCGNAASKG